MRRLLLRVVLALAVAGVAGLAVPGVVSAHALRQSSVPDANAVLDTPPSSVSITFGEDPDPRASSISVLDAGGREHRQGTLQVAPGDPRTLRVGLDHLGNGVYTVSWRTLSTVDGHRAAGTFAFGVGVGAQSVSAAGGAQGAGDVSGSSRLSAAQVAGRWMLYVGLFAAFGAALVGAAILRRPADRAAVQAMAGAIVAVAGTALVVASQAVDAGVGWSELLSTSLGHTLVQRSVSVGAALLAAGASLRLRAGARRVALLATAAAAAVAMLADVANSHAAAASHELVNVALQWVHVAAAAFWIGGLAALLLCLHGGAEEPRAAAVRRFSAAAAIALSAVLVTGLVRAAVEIGAWDRVLATDYGRLVIVKVVLIAGLAGLGGVNRWRHVPRAGEGLSGLRRVGSTEVLVGVGAVLVAAMLVNVAPPTSAASSGGAPPAPPSAVTVDAADYATTMRLHVTVTPGAPGFNTFEVRLTDYDSGAPVDAASVQLAFSLPARPALPSSTLVLERVGAGDFRARGGNLSFDGVWTVRALVERGAGSVDVSLHVVTRSAPQQIDVSSQAGQPTLYTIHLAAGRTCQVYLDPQVPGRSVFHATFFDARGNGLPATVSSIASTGPDATTQLLAPRRLEPGHYVADLTLAAGAYRFDVDAADPAGAPITTHIDITVKPGG